MKSKKKPPTTQLEFEFDRPREPDRNHERGGRSFYFFDLDDNVLFLSTPIYIYHRQTGAEVALSTRDFAKVNRELGKSGTYQEYELCFENDKSFRRFRDIHQGDVQPFLQDIQEVLMNSDLHWKGPSWRFFYHAVYNQRPVSIITARGHHPETLKQGLSLLANEGHLPATPNYIAVYPVSHPETRLALGDHASKSSTAQLKKQAILRSVEQAMSLYGMNGAHRFGMSDDDPHNVELIIEAMRELKGIYPDNSFFVIPTHQEPIVKHEIFLDHVETQRFPDQHQLELFLKRS